MPKQTFLKRTDETPPVRNGEFVATSTVLQISQLAMTSPFVGDFQIIGQGRLIVGEHPDLGERFIVTSGGAFAFNAAGTRTFAVWTRGDGVHTGGDVYLGHPDNFLMYDQSEGTLGLYTAAGAGFIADSDGSLFAGDSDGAHMRWNSASRALEVRNGEDVKISLDANGDGFFDGTIYASGGRIYGQMQVDGLFRAGDVDGPSISLGRFERTNDLSELVESSEIIATDTNNLPWFHVVAGGGTAGGGWFQVGNPGDYQQRLTYDGARLALDGDIYARGGEIIDLTLTGNLTMDGGSIIADTVTIDDTGITIDALLGKYDSGGIRWIKNSDATEYLRIGTQVDLGSITANVIDSQGVKLSLVSSDDINILTSSSNEVIIGTSANTGLRVGAISSAAALGLFGVTVIERPTTSHASASFTVNSGTAVNDASTFDGYTIKQIVKALRDLGALT